MRGGKGTDGGSSGGGSMSAEVAAVRRRQWQCGDGVPLARENSSAIKIVGGCHNSFLVFVSDSSKFRLAENLV
jgi:hypothetical protein